MTNEMTGFDDKAVRRAFIRKVYGILMVQLIVTAGIMAVFMFVSEVKMYERTNTYPLCRSYPIICSGQVC